MKDGSAFRDFAAFHRGGTCGPYSRSFIDFHCTDTLPSFAATKDIAAAPLKSRLPSTRPGGRLETVPPTYMALCGSRAQAGPEANGAMHRSIAIVSVLCTLSLLRPIIPFSARPVVPGHQPEFPVPGWGIPWSIPAKKT